MVRIENPKTYKRSLPVFEGSKYLREWLKVHPKRDDQNAQLFPIGYPALLDFVRRLGSRALNKHVHPQLIRDSLATWLASRKVGRYQMCKLMGWAMSSDMPDRYIDRTGVVEEEAIQSIRGDELSKVESENNDLKMALKRLEVQSNQLQEKMAKREQIDAFLTVLLKDEDFRTVVVERIKDRGLGKKLISL